MKRILMLRKLVKIEFLRTSDIAKAKNHIAAITGMSYAAFEGALHRFPSGSSFRISTPVNSNFFWMKMQTLSGVSMEINVRINENKRTIDLSEVKSLRTNANVMKPVFGTIIGFAEIVRAKKIELIAGHVGRYAWIKYGFVPSTERWLTMQQQIMEIAQQYLALGGDAASDSLRNICQDPDPKAIRRIPALKQPEVRMHPTSEAAMPLGKVIMLHSQMNNWTGTIDLADRETVAAAKSYCASHIPLGLLRESMVLTQ
jgi:hypothetical protein